MKAVVAVIACTTLFIAGCSSSGGSTATSAHAPSSETFAPSPAFTPTPAQDAATIAAHIPGCAGTETADIGGGRQSGMVSSATCTYEGHLVIVNTYSEYGEVGVDPALIKHIYFAYGHNWQAFLADQGVGADKTTLQMQLTNDAAGLFDQAQSGDVPTPVPLATQKQLTEQIAAALHGSAGGH